MQNFEKGGSDYHGEGECVGGECAPSTGSTKLYVDDLECQIFYSMSKI